MGILEIEAYLRAADREFDTDKKVEYLITALYFVIGELKEIKEEIKEVRSDGD